MRVGARRLEDDMRPGGGSSKGGQFERDICKALSLWVSGGKRTDIFWRTALSGGRAKILLRAGKEGGAQAGDVGMIHPMGAKFLELFLVDAKSRADLHLHSFITERKDSILDFWKKVCEEADSFNRSPILIAKQNFLPVLFCIDTKGLGLFLGERGFSSGRILRRLEIITVPRWDIRIFHFTEFMAATIPFKVKA